MKIESRMVFMTHCTRVIGAQPGRFLASDRQPALALVASHPNSVVLYPSQPKKSSDIALFSWIRMGSHHTFRRYYTILSHKSKAISWDRADISLDFLLGMGYTIVRESVYSDERSALSTKGTGASDVLLWGARGVVEGVTELCGLGIAVSLYFYF